MRTAKRSLLTAIWALGLSLALVLSPRSAAAQCTMMGGGGHDHGATQDASARKLSSSEKKQRESVSRLLSDEQGRRVLGETLLSDPGFMREFIARLLGTPEWRALATQELARKPADGGAAATPADQQSYVCPMHPEVTSSKPGTCPKCGMTLVRAAPDAAR